MARRTGKAATRRARQQRRTRQGPSPSATPPTPVVPSPVAPISEAASGATTVPAAPRRPALSFNPASTSRLGETAREEYHYVVRDLRNTGILVLVMIALLAAAVVLVNASGIAPS